MSWLLSTTQTCGCAAAGEPIKIRLPRMARKRSQEFMPSPRMLVPQVVAGKCGGTGCWESKARCVACLFLCRCYGASGEGMAPLALFNGYRRSSPMSQQHFDASRSLTALEQDSTIIAVIEMSEGARQSWRDQPVQVRPR